MPPGAKTAFVPFSLCHGATKVHPAELLHLVTSAICPRHLKGVRHGYASSAVLRVCGHLD